MITIGFLIAYDFEYLKLSLPCVYNHADRIVLALDAERKSFAGNVFFFDNAFIDWIFQFDRDKKIEWFEQSFYESGLTPMEVDLRTRNILLRFMYPAKWYLQIDCDEYFVNFSEFVIYLNNLDHSDELQQITCKWKTLFKQTNHGFLTISGKPERIPIAINKPYYSSVRNNRDANVINSEFVLLHQSWARSSDEIMQKLVNWSHTRDFDLLKFYSRWLNCTKHNYRKFINFHPIHGTLWPRLEFIEGKNVQELIEYYSEHPRLSEDPNPIPIMYLIKSKLKRLLGKK